MTNLLLVPNPHKASIIVQKMMRFHHNFCQSIAISFDRNMSVQWSEYACQQEQHLVCRMTSKEHNRQPNQKKMQERCVRSRDAYLTFRPTPMIFNNSFLASSTDNVFKREKYVESLMVYFKYSIVL